MSIEDNGRDESIDSRTVRALTEPLTVLTVDKKPVRDSDTTIVSVTSHSGSSYTVDLRELRCDCPDAEYNLDDEQQCKHQIRARVALGRDTVDTATLATLDVDAGLGSNCPGPVVATSDGGRVGDGETEQWSGPFTEYDRYGEPTGERFVRCRDCGREVIAGK